MALDSSAEDRAYLASSIASTGADYLVLDSAEDCVTKPREDIEVRAMFGHLSNLMANAELKGIMMAGFLRKRAQGEYGRTFDDLFGPRVWKARLSKALYLEGGRLLCFKDRGRDVTPLRPAKRRGPRQGSQGRLWLARRIPKPTSRASRRLYTGGFPPTRTVFALGALSAD